MTENAELDIRIKMMIDAAAAKAASEAVKKLGSDAKGMGQQFTQARSSMEQIRQASGQLTSVGARVAAMGGAITFGLVNAAKNYINQVQTSTSVSRQWLFATREIEVAYMRIGKVAATALLPYLQLAAQLAKTLANYLEKNPKALETAAKAGLGLLAGGTGMVFAGQAGMAMMGVSSLLKTLGIGGGAAALGGAAIKGIGGALGGGAAGGMAIPGYGAMLGGFAAMVAKTLAVPLVAGGIALGTTELLRKTDVGKAVFRPAGEVATVAAYGVGKALGGEEQGLAWAKTIGILTGAFKNADGSTMSFAQKIEKLGGAEDMAGKELEQLLPQLKAYISYHRAEQQAQRQFLIQRRMQERDFQLQERYATEDYNKQLTRTRRDFNLQELFTARAHYRQMAIASRDHYIQMGRAEEDFQRSRNRAAFDHEFDLYQIALTGDAMQYWLSQRQFNIEKSRAEEDYEIQRSRQQQDFARQQNDAEVSYQIERQQRLMEFNIRLSDQAIDFAIQRARAKEQHQIQLADALIQFNEERMRRKQALYDQLNDLYGNLEQERILRQQFNSAMLADLGAAISAAQAMTKTIMEQAPLPKFQEGGYSSGGTALLHPGEFVLTAATTAAAERAAKSNKLSQDGILRLLSGGGGMTYNDHRSFDSKVSAEDRAAIRSDTRELLLSLFPA